MPMRIAESMEMNSINLFIYNNTYTYLDTTQEILARPNQSIAIHKHSHTKFVRV
jgi:hypothetical protein